MGMAEESHLLRTASSSHPGVQRSAAPSLCLHSGWTSWSWQVVLLFCSTGDCGWLLNPCLWPRLVAGLGQDLWHQALKLYHGLWNPESLRPSL